ncbi:SAM domain-containing protein [Ruegeria arenilitoris]|uniref:SAM domain-containing protein n=1 Tax=Ruegeria arenilitoris TaxID=1173585 RepID=UPI00147C42E2
MDSIVKWPRDHELHEHARSFKENGIRLDLVAKLSEDDLKDLGLNLGDRRRFQAAVRESVASPIPTTATAQPTVSNAERRQLTGLFRIPACP